MRLGTALLSLWMDFRKAISTGPPPSTLLDDLVSYWPLNEVSGVRYDAVGSNDLTDNNTVASVNRGPLGVAAKFIAANSERLSVADNASLSGGTGKNFTFSMWVRPTAVSGDQGIFSKGTSAAASTLQYFLELFNDDLYWYVGDAVTASYATKKVNGAGLWTHVICGFDQTDGKGFLYVNNGTVALSGALPSGSIQDGTGDFSIGRYSTNVYYGGDIGAFAAWSRVLTSNERATIFAAGNGIKYADLPVGLSTDLISYWNLDEPSGTRTDSHGSNDLTDNNTVGSVINAGSAMDGAAASFVSANSESLSVADPFYYTSFSISMWVYPTDLTGFSTLIAKDDGGANREWNVFLADTDITLLFFDSVSYQQNAGKGTLTLNAWNHVIVTFDESDSKGRAYVNNGTAGVGLAINGAIRSAAAPLQIGTSAGAGFFDGYIDEVAVWSRVLTADERTELYNAGAGKYYDFS